MSERKTINKFRGHNFFEEGHNSQRRSRIKKKIGGNGGSSGQTVRLMAPFSLKCLACGEYIAKNRKFNAKKETMKETYLGIRIYRFRIRCPRCSNVISYRTDPKTADYITESGAVRNYISKENEALKYEKESIDDTLERLEREEKETREKEEQRGVVFDTDSSAMEKLEKKLAQNEKELESSLEIEGLLKKNMMRDQGVISKEDLEIKQAAKNAFKKKEKANGSAKIRLVEGARVMKVKKKGKVVI